ncbi:MAG: alpha/beta hydrolase [Ruminococcaceae bacterium]|nr:alpha/beta hydrolase [Oscillospiraceae bacterium]
MLWLLLTAGLLLFFTYICYRLVFYVPPRPAVKSDAIVLPKGTVYDPFRDQMTEWIREMRAIPTEEFHIRSFDGLELYAHFYEYAPGAPVELMFHGYRGNAERDLAGGVQRCFALGRSALLVDQRCSGKSGGSSITFGIREHRDCLAWAAFAAAHFGPERKLILTGISMGASTVLMAADQDLPESVVGILADCGFTSAPAIIKDVMRKIHLPASLLYPFVRLGGRLFGGFDIEERSALEAVKGSKLPVIFFHGEADAFVPCKMSRENFEACASRKALITVPGAGHGLSYPMDPERYLSELRAFFEGELA